LSLSLGVGAVYRFACPNIEGATNKGQSLIIVNWATTAIFSRLVRVVDLSNVMSLLYFSGLGDDSTLLFFLIFQDSFYLFFRIRVFFALRMNMKICYKTDKVMIELLKLLDRSYFKLSIVQFGGIL